MRPQGSEGHSLGSTSCLLLILQEEPNGGFTQGPPSQAGLACPASQVAVFNAKGWGLGLPPCNKSEDPKVSRGQGGRGGEQNH